MVLAAVVVAAHNIEPYLGRCLDSVVAQTESDIEVVVVDDGSTDSTGQVADRYSASDSRISVVHRENGGLSAARNTGLAQAHGQFVIFPDGDDWIDPNWSCV